MQRELCPRGWLGHLSVEGRERLREKAGASGWAALQPVLPGGKKAMPQGLPSQPAPRALVPEASSLRLSHERSNLE